MMSAFAIDPLTKRLVGRGVVNRSTKSLTILWTGTEVTLEGPVQISHFVPLLKKVHCAVSVDTVVYDSSTSSTVDVHSI